MFQMKYFASALAAAAVVSASATPAYAYVQPIWLEVNQSYYMPQTSAIKRVAVTNPKIADVKVINNHAINIVALASGSTSLTVWNANGMRQEFTVSVSPADSNLAAWIQKAIGLPNVKVEKIGDKILLRGTVMNQRERDTAVKIASLYLDQVSAGSGQNNTISANSANNRQNDGNKDSLINSNIARDDDDYSNDRIINLLELENPDQINLEAEVIELSTDDAKKLGIEYGEDTSSPGTYSFKTGTVNRDKGSKWYSKNWLYTHFSDIGAKVHALLEDGKGRIISQPNITTMSGKTAGILIGGKVPYPVSNGDNSTSVQYENYGIELDMLKPEVDKDGNVTSRLYASVSRLDWSNAVTVNGFNMPGIATRSAETMVNIPSGMTMAIGGLMNSDDSDSVSSVPVLGKIPVLGELFKYHNKTKQKTEILILITPRVVNETTPAKMTKPMAKTYMDARKEDQSMYRVDLNHPQQDAAEQSQKPDGKNAQASGKAVSQQQ